MKQQGFTLLELMIVVVLLSVMAAIALPMYSQYVRKSHEKLAVQKIGDIALKLEKEKTRNFSYENFKLLHDDKYVFKSKSSSDKIYTIQVAATMLGWSVAACVNPSLPNSALYKNFAMNNKNIKCEWVDDKCTDPDDIPDECK
ncbi:type IV pilin protein [Acinetobacter sp. YH12100]|uniref:type IV pilin protein n=1 Tax=Acinetobacter sp. YH12100 TaxID=2601089 RepID=UPI0015D0E656|nr:prepilin-type N-terminal cleavage/methylation domain-containing protein [Acinetobacter sp. YH12100]